MEPQLLPPLCCMSVKMRGVQCRLFITLVDSSSKCFVHYSCGQFK